MKNKGARSGKTTISNSRWIGYATAGAATAVGSAVTADAAIHYSGPLNITFNAPASSYVAQSFTLDQAADHFGLIHQRTSSSAGIAKFGIFSANANASAKFAGFSAGGFPYVSKLTFGANINGANFGATSNIGTLAFKGGYANSQWLAAGTGFIGFKFNTGSGIEYGWARITMDGAPGNSFTLVDFAYGDVGDMITAGQESAVPEPGSLALLALGGAGLMAWRKRRGAKAVAA